MNLATAASSYPMKAINFNSISSPLPKANEAFKGQETRPIAAVAVEPFFFGLVRFLLLSSSSASSSSLISYRCCCGCDSQTKAPKSVDDPATPTHAYTHSHI